MVQMHRKKQRRVRAIPVVLSLLEHQNGILVVNIDVFVKESSNLADGPALAGRLLL